MTEQVGTDIPRWDLSDRMRKALRHADVGVQEMAEWLEVSRHTIGNWINGHTRPRPAELKQWAMRTGVSYPWLTYGDPPSELPRVDSSHQPADFEKEPRPFGAAEKLAFLKALPIRVVEGSPVWPVAR